ncbi:MAG TPA: aldose 1-epimerase [Solirubrobacteraceae bacterium]|nr:aldose 1-epimerase [Solirubrobacteraceae bacterium]
MASLERIPIGQLEAVVLVSDELRAGFVPAAGMIGHSLEHRGEELLVQRGGLDAWRGTGRSFGLPLLHPWANRLRDWRYAAAGRAVTIDRSRGVVRADENDLPIHGALAAAEDWDVVDAGADGAAAWLSAALDYGRRDDRLAVFPFPHVLELELRLEGDALSITSTVVPTAATEVPLAFGWHPWLALPGVPRAEWELALPARTAIALDARNLPTGDRAEAGPERAALGDRALDDHSAVAEDARLVLAGGGREIAVEWAGGYRYAQVFAPTALDVACLEPMMAPVAALCTGEDLELAQPGERVSATFRVRVTQRPPGVSG